MASSCYKERVQREFSAGGVLVRLMARRTWFAAIRPGGRPEGIWALPKGLIEGESPELTALREIEEETGCRGHPVGKLGDVRYAGGRIGDIPPEFRKEVAEARWLPLEDAPRLLAYKGEREMAEKALMMLAAGAPL